MPPSELRATFSLRSLSLVLLTALPSSLSVPSSTRWNLLPAPQMLMKSLSESSTSPLLLPPQGHLVLSLRSFAVEYISAANSDLEVNASMGSVSLSEHLSRKR